MRQSKAQKQKVSSKEKQKLRKEYQELQKQLYKIVIPSLVAIFLFIVAYVYIKTRPRSSYVD
ncbi:unnamed protein product [Acanthoscelides obtectus]|uniref:Single-pass membrane and coiled-coil domain-containing protein 4 homolog n=1 Tax=Acanthoscelides obtectus TaxID=200917 RepID=A0A9P0P1V6_ACAOB|nr:unnamed protein product [Acanthoscelides obtectus]CAK1653092.1 Single-pass membrane and coiled-coil domain-containing protein 4 homolog [Acanthoscelides obtectus]